MEATDILREDKEVKWFKRQHQKAFSPEALTAFLLMLTHDIVKDTIQSLREDLDAEHWSKLLKIEDELILFFIFALDYHWTTLSSFTQEEKRIFREAFFAHLQNVVPLDTLQERLTAYTQIAIEKEGSPVMFFDFGRKFSEFCGMSGDPLLLLLPAELFKTAAESVFSLRSVRLKLK